MLLKGHFVLGVKSDLGGQDPFAKNPLNRKFTRHGMHFKTHYSKVIGSQFRPDLLRINGTPNMPRDGHFVQGPRGLWGSFQS